MPRRPDTSPQTLLVLGALLEAPGEWHYGYDLSRRLGLASGTLYPILVRLAERGWLDTRWVEAERAGRPPRHTYRLTAAGQTLARSRLGSAASTAQPDGPMAQPGRRAATESAGA